MIVTFTPVNIGGPDPALFAGISGSTAGTIVGGENALQVADEDAAYVEVESPGHGVATFTLVPDKPTPPADQLIQVWWAAQFRLLEPAAFPTAQDYVVAFLGGNVAGNYATEDPPTHSSSWVTVETSRFPLGYGPTAEQLYTAWAFDPTLIGAVDAAQRTQVSWLRFYAEFPGLRPLQHRQRTDTYGVGGVQAARTRTTFQSSLGARRPV